jgi:peptidyl-prolyl cis-trans isomerase C
MVSQLFAGPQPAAERSLPHASPTEPKQSPFARRWLREPLVHFLLAGALIFAIYQLLSPTANQADRTTRDRADEGRSAPVGDAVACARADAADG